MNESFYPEMQVIGIWFSTIVLSIAAVWIYALFLKNYGRDDSL
jgi:hypothetical protein